RMLGLLRVIEALRNANKIQKGVYWNTQPLAYNLDRPERNSLSYHFYLFCFIAPTVFSAFRRKAVPLEITFFVCYSLDAPFGIERGSCSCFYFHIATYFSKYTALLLN